MTVGERIKEIRKAKGFTQKQLAEAIGYSSQQAVAKLENSDNAPKAKTLEKIAEVLNVTPEQLYYDPSEYGYRTVYSSKLHKGEINVDQYLEIEKIYTAIDIDFAKLNIKGKIEAAKRVHELTLIPEYTEKD